MAVDESATVCGAPKNQGAELLACQLVPGHDAGDDATWHEALVTDHREMDFGTSRIVVDTQESISWEPFEPFQPFRETLKRGIGRASSETRRA